MELKTQNAADRHRGTASRLDQAMAMVLFGLLAAYSLFIGDYTLIAVRAVSAVLFLTTGIYVAVTLKKRLHWSLAFICPLMLCLYGLGQTRWSDQRIVYNGLDKSLFWFTLAVIAFAATQVFQKWRTADEIRTAIAIFGSFEALLSVLEQASHTGRYFWLIPSGFPDIYGTFPYYNNFSQLIELTLPITLWEGVRHRNIRMPYLVLAALQVGAVIASSSRAGSLLIFAELLLVLLLAWKKGRNSVSFPVVILALLLSFGFTFVTGFHEVMQKLGRPDQLSNRKLINQSSLNMIRQRPLTGWGLGAYVPVYPMFALYDDGTWVNQAHNDYLEWAAEGGIPYAFVMVLLIGWSLRPSLRCVWGVGLLAFALHALVDYPFARLGTCGWYFALAAMLAAQGKEDPEKHRRARRRSQRTQLAENETELQPAVTA